MSRPSQVQFTLKFRARDQAWQWASDSFGEQDGEIRFQAPEFRPGSLHSCCSSLDPALGITLGSKASEQNTVTVWEICQSVPGAEDPRSGYSTRMIGIPRDFTHWFALVRHSTAWIAPRLGKEKIMLDTDAIFCSFLRRDGLHLILLAVTVADLVTVLITNEDGELLMVGKNDSLESGQSIVIAALGTTFQDANAAAMARAENVVRMSQPLPLEIWNSAAGGNVYDDAEKPQGWYDGLTYCTWNALGQDLDEEKIYNALQVLSEHGVKITNVLIDDNWQSLDHAGASQFERGWTDFEANEKGFPNKLSGLTAGIRQRHPTIHHIGVWHGVFGYWGGVAPDGNLAKKYRTKWVHKERDYCDRDSLTAFEGDDASQMYEDFYKFLQVSGVDSAKADTRYLLDCLSSSNDRRNMIRKYNKAWLQASSKYFSMHVVSCMAMIPQLLFSPELLFKPTTSQHQQRLIMRISDDFFPEIESSHLWHIFWNAHNAVLTQHLNIIPDWDMFQTTHDYSSFHAAARCVSGGPVCITDYPGKHSLPLIKQLVADLPDGSSLILRPSVAGRSVQVYNAHKEERFCKVAAFHDVCVGKRELATGTAIMGVFNMSVRTRVEWLPLTEFLNFQVAGVEYVLRSYVTGKIVAPLSGASESRSLVKLELGRRGYDILTLYPLLLLGLRWKFAVLGLLGQMSGAAAVIGIDVKAGIATVSTRLKALGFLGLFVTGQEADNENVLAVTAKLCGERIPEEYQHVEDLKNVFLLKLDLVAAWKDLMIPPDHQIMVEVVVD